jgi:hypothetical protein
MMNQIVGRSNRSGRTSSNQSNPKQIKELELGADLAALLQAGPKLAHYAGSMLVLFGPPIISDIGLTAM